MDNRYIMLTSQLQTDSFVKDLLVLKVSNITQIKDR